jgi:flagellar protein FlbD
MIHLTRLNHLPMVLNSDLIEHIEVTPDTVITLTTGEKIMVLESVEQIVERIVRFRRSIFQGLCAWFPRAEGRPGAEPEAPSGGPAA